MIFVPKEMTKASMNKRLEERRERKRKEREKMEIEIKDSNKQ